MRKLNFLLDIGILICIVIFITWSLRLFSDQNSMTLNNNIKYLVEQSYFEGQRDALSGDIRIKKISDSCWSWTESCWDDGTPTTFNPTNKKNK